MKLRLHESLKNIIGFSYSIDIEYSLNFLKLNYILIGKISILIKNNLIESLPWKLRLSNSASHTKVEYLICVIKKRN